MMNAFLLSLFYCECVLKLPYSLIHERGFGVLGRSEERRVGKD